MVSGDVALIGAVPESALLKILFGADLGWPEAGAKRWDVAAPIVLWVHEAIQGAGVAVVCAAGRGLTVPFAARLETVQKSPFPTFEFAEGTSLYTSLDVGTVSIYKYYLDRYLLQPDLSSLHLSY